MKLDLLAVILGVVWLVGITNAFDLLDNIDGSPRRWAVACAVFAVDAISGDSGELALIVALALGGACVGFLPFNLRPGRKAVVFMGDSGGQVIGFGLASLALASRWTTAGATLTGIVLPLLVLAIPVLDTTLVTVRRTSSGVRSRKEAPTTRRTGSCTTASPSGRLWRL